MHKILFIDIRDADLSIYEFELRKGVYELKNKSHHPLSGDLNFSVDMFPGGAEETYVSLSLSRLNFRMLELPFSEKERIREVLPYELDDMILGGSNKVVFDDVVTGQLNNKYQVLAVYIEKAAIEEILRALQTFGLDPVFITSLELREVVKDFSFDRLLSPPEMEDEKRIHLAAEEMKSPTINLRRDEFAYTRDAEETKKSLRVTAILAILLTVVLSADVLLKIISARNEIALLKNEMRKTYQEIFPDEKKIVNELYQLKAHVKELKNKETIFVGVDPLGILLKLSEIDKQGVIFTEVTADRDNIILKGEASSLSNVQKVKDLLEDIFVQVNISESKSSTQGKMLFTIATKERNP